MLVTARSFYLINLPIAEPADLSACCIFLPRPPRGDSGQALRHRQAQHEEYSVQFSVSVSEKFYCCNHKNIAMIKNKIKGSRSVPQSRIPSRFLICCSSPSCIRTFCQFRRNRLQPPSENSPHNPRQRRRSPGETNCSSVQPSRGAPGADAALP